MELTLSVEHQCNLRCTYCYTGAKANRTMSLETAKKAVDLGFKRHDGHIELGFFGGEPLLRFDLLRATWDYLKAQLNEAPHPRPAVRLLVNTNATLLTEPVLDWLSAEKGYCNVSLDGNPAAHDRHRLDLLGRGSHAKVLAGIASLKERGIGFQLVGVVTPETAPGLGSSTEHLLGLGADRVSLAMNLRANWDEAAIAGLRQGLAEAGRAWANRFRAGQQPWLEPFVGLLISHVSGGNPCPVRCHLAGTELAVSPGGRLFPCGELIGEDQDDRWVIGDVDRGVDREKVAQLQGLKDRVEDTCAPCALRDRCQSQCGCQHVALTGELGMITETLCNVEEACIEATDRIAEELWAEKCSAFVDYVYGRRWEPSPGAVLTPLRRARDGSPIELGSSSLPKPNSPNESL